MRHARSDYQHIQDPSGKIPEEEPVFLLRGQDWVAAGTVRYWARSNREMGGDPYLSTLAEAHADRMDAWPNRKSADGPPLETLLHRRWGGLTDEERARLPLGTRLGTLEPFGFYLQKIGPLTWGEVESPQCIGKRAPQCVTAEQVQGKRLVIRLGFSATTVKAETTPTPVAKPVSLSGWLGMRWGEVPVGVREMLPPGTILSPRFAGGFYLQKDPPAPHGEWVEIPAPPGSPAPEMPTELRPPCRMPEVSIHPDQRLYRMGTALTSTPGSMPTEPVAGSQGEPADRTQRLDAAQVLHRLLMEDPRVDPTFEDIEDATERTLRIRLVRTQQALDHHVRGRSLILALDLVLPGWFDVDTSHLTLNGPLPFTVHDRPEMWVTALVSAGVDMEIAEGLVRESQP